MKIFTTKTNYIKTLVACLGMMVFLINPQKGLAQIYSENFESYTANSVLSTTASATGWRTTDNANTNGRRNHWFITYNKSCNNNGNASLSIGILTSNSPFAFTSCDYNENVSRDVTAYNSFSSSGYTSLQLSFTWKCVGESDFSGIYDYGQVGYSTDGTNWTYLSTQYYNRSSTATANVSLPASLNNLPIIYLGFRWKNDGNTTDGIGFVVDNISVTGTPTCTNPVIGTQPTNSSVCAGANTSFSVSATGSSLTYQWQYSTNGGGSWTSATGGVYSNGTTPTLSITGATAGMNGYLYRCIVYSGTCSSTSSSAILGVTASPTATAGGAQTICSTGGTLTGFSASNYSNITWVTTGDGSFSPTAGTVNPTYIPGPNDITAGSAKVTMTAVANSPCTVNASTSQVTVSIKPQPTATVTGTSSTCQNQPFTIPSGAATASNGTISWSTTNGGGTFTNGTTLTPTYTPVAADAGKAIVLTMTVSNSPCTAATGNYTLNVSAQPTATVTGTSSTCQNQPFTIPSGAATASNGTISWSTTNGGGTFTNGITLTPTYTPVAADAGKAIVLTMTVSNSPCTAATGNYTLNVSAQPTATVTGTSSTCQNQPFTIPSGAATASNGTISWSTTNGGGTFTNGTTLIPTYTPVAADAGKAIVLTMTVSNSPCTAATGNYTLNVNPLPTAVITGSTTVCQNDAQPNITFAGANGTTPYTFSYNINGGSIQTATTTGGNTSVDVPVPTTATGDFTYTLLSVQDNSSTRCSNAASGQATVSVKGLPIVDAPTVSLSEVCASTHTAVTFSVNATSPTEDALTYQWFKGTPPGGVAVTGIKTSPDYTINNPVGSSAGDYYVVVTGSAACGSVTSTTVHLDVDKPIDITSGPDATTVCDGDQATFTVNFTGTPASVLWLKDGSPVSGSEYSVTTGTNYCTLTVNPATTSDAGDYSLLINGDPNAPCSQAFSDPATLTVNTKSADPTSASASSIEICAGSSTTLTLNGGGGGTGEVVQWYANSCGTGTPITGNNVSVSPTTTTTYWGRYEDGTPCNYNSICKPVTITVDQPPVGGTAASSTGQTAVCYGTTPDNITVSGYTSTVVKWQWSPDGTSGSWADIPASNNDVLTSAQMGALTATTYYRAIIKNGVCTDAKSNPVKITVNSLPVVVTHDQSNCSPGTVDLTAAAVTSGSTPAGLTYTYYTDAAATIPLANPNNISISGTYYIKGTNSSTGCYDIESVQVTINPKPIVVIANPDAVCSPGTVDLTAGAVTAGSTAGLTYAYYTNAAGTIVLSNPNAVATSGTYYIKGTVAATGCYDIEPVSVTVNTTPSIGFTNNTPTRCYNTPISITLTNPNNVTGTVLSWTRVSDNPGVIGAGSGTGNINETLVNTTTSNIIVTYTLTAKQPVTGCSSSTTTTVTLYPQFNGNNLQIGYSQVVCFGANATTLTIVNSVTGGSGTYNYQWQRSNNGTTGWATAPGTSNTSTYSPGTVYFTTYYYRLIVTDAAGCGSATSINVVEIDPGADLGYNDYKLSPDPGPLCSGSTFPMNVRTSSILGLFGDNITFSWSEPDSYISSATVAEGTPYGYKVSSGFFSTYFEGDATFVATNNTNATVYPVLTITPTNGDCSFSSLTTTVTIYPVPTATVTPPSPICSGSSAGVLLKGNITDVPTSFSWYATVTSGSATGFSTSASPGNSGNVSVGNTYTISEIITNTGTIPATVHYTITPSANGCSGTPVTVDLIVNPSPSLTITNPVPVCAPNTVDLTTAAVTAGSTSGLTYTYWTDAAATISLANPNAVSSSGTYYIKGTIGATGCYIIKPVTVTINPQLPVSVSVAASPSGAICTGTSVMFTATPTNGGTSPVYQWKVNGTNVGTNSNTYSSSSLNNGDVVTCTLTSNATPCATSNPFTSTGITMAVNPNLPVSVSVAASPSGAICTGTSVMFTATPTNGGTSPVYQWKVNGTNVGTNSNTYSSSSLNNGDVVTCTLTSNATPCATNNPFTSTGITMAVNPNLPVSVSVAASPSGAICTGTSVMFTATPTNGGTSPVYQWKVNGTNVGTNSNTYSSSSLNNGDVVTCTLTSNATPCATNNPFTSTGITMTVNPNVTAGTITGGTFNPCVGTTINYFTSGTAGGSWTTDDATGTVITVTPISATQVKVTAVGVGTATLYYGFSSGSGFCGAPQQTSQLITVRPSATLTLNSGSGSASQQPCYGTAIIPIVYKYGGSATDANVTNLPAGLTVTKDAVNSTIKISGTPTASGTYTISTTGGCTSPNATGTISFSVSYTWTGSTSTDWTDSRNWCSNNAPNSSAIDVYIPNTTRQPVLPVDGIKVHDIAIDLGATVDLNGHTFEIDGTFSGSNTGVLKGSASSGLIIGGSAGTIYFDQTTNNVTNVLKTLTLNNTASATLGNDLNIAAGTFSSPGIVTVGPNTGSTAILHTDDVTGGGILTLKSDANGDAQVGTSYGAIPGNVVVERFVPARRAWRFMGVPFKSSTQTINEAWQEGQTNSDIFVHNNFKPGYGTEITYDNDVNHGFDVNTTLNPSLKTWQQGSASWTTYAPYTNSTLITDNGGAYCLFVRGSRAVDLSQAINAPADNTTLRIKGILNEPGSGSNAVSFSNNKSGEYLFLSNPYASAIDLTNLLNTGTGINPNNVFVWDPKLNGSYGVGDYVTFSTAGGGTWAPTSDAYTGSYGGIKKPIIQSGQAFMLQTSSGSASQSFTFNQTDKINTQTNGNVFKPAATASSRIFVNLMMKSADSLLLINGIAAVFDNQYSAAVDAHDAPKLWNNFVSTENIGLQRGTSYLAVEARPTPVLNDTEFVYLTTLAKNTQVYALKIFSDQFDPKIQAWLVDKFLGTRTRINMSGTVYPFATTGSDTSYRNRFIIVFNRGLIATPVPVTRVTNQANPGTSGNANSIAGAASGISVHPNPVKTGEKVLLEFSNMKDGRYQVTVTNALGKALTEKTIDHNGGSQAYTLQTDAGWAAGVYIIKVTCASGCNYVTKLVISK